MKPTVQKDMLASVLAEVAFLEKKEMLQQCVDADNPMSRPTEKQIEIFKTLNGNTKYSIILGGNQSSKTTTAIRLLTWVLEDAHPYWRRPTDKRCNNRLCNSENTLHWGHETVPRYRCLQCGNEWEIWNPDTPMHIMLVGENQKNLYLNLWDARIRRLLVEPDMWKPVKAGPYIAWVQHRRTEDKIIFFPHGHGEETVRKATQGFTIHFVFGDEIAPVGVLEETQRRVDAKLGYWFFACTIKGKQNTPELIRFLTKQEESKALKVFKLSMLDNPKYFGMRDVILAKLAGLTKEQRDAVLYGDVDVFDESVLKFSKDLLGENGIPSTYSKSWRHVLIVDPAIQSIAGYMVIAEDPSDKIWHVVDAQKLKGMQDGLELFERVEDMSYSYNIVRKVSDNQAWFIGAAKKRGVKYMPPPNKQGKIMGGKIYLIKQAQIFISEGRLKIPFQFEELWDELSTYRWQEGSDDKIVKSSRYHLLDCLFYFVDSIPKAERESKQSLPWEQQVMMYNRVKLAKKSGDRSLPSDRRSIKMYTTQDAKRLLDQMTRRGRR